MKKSNYHKVIGPEIRIFVDKECEHCRMLPGPHAFVSEPGEDNFMYCFNCYLNDSDMSEEERTKIEHWLLGERIDYYEKKLEELKSQL